MPTVERPDGIQIHWDEHGEGPLVVVAGYWSMHPSTFTNLIEELSGDHRVVLYDDRGTGRSTRQGPYDLGTSADDLAAVIEAAGPPAVVICSADGANRAVRVVSDHPELIVGLIGVGGAPVARQAFAESDAMAASDTVVGALMSQVETDYRGALRGILTATNPQMSEAELRERVSVQIDHCPQEAGIERMRAWIADDPSEYARNAGDRLWVAIADNLGGGWFPTGEELRRRVREDLPNARLVEIDDGFVTRPDQTADIVRTVVAAHKALEATE
jgi:pimeloyl-ACP methyl ester carboxylesterase